MGFVAAQAFDLTFNAAGDSHTQEFDAGSSANRCMVAAAGFDNSSGHTLPANCTFNGVNVVNQGATVTQGGLGARLWLLHGPASGSNNFILDPGAGVDVANCCLLIMVYDSIDSGTPSDGYTTAVGTDTTAELVVTSAIGDTPLFFCFGQGLNPSAIAPTLYTERLDNPVANDLIGGSGEGTGAAAVAFVGTFTADILNNWIALGLNLNNTGGGGGGGASPLTGGGKLFKSTTVYPPIVQHNRHPDISLAAYYRERERKQREFLHKVGRAA